MGNETDKVSLHTSVFEGVCFYRKGLVGIWPTCTTYKTQTRLLGETDTHLSHLINHRAEDVSDH